jgi:hypothetical protein
MNHASEMHASQCVGTLPASTASFPGTELYRQLDDDINQVLNADIGFTALIRPDVYPMDDATVDGYRTRYRLIKTFQERTLEIFKASLNGDCDPEIAASVLGDVPAHLGTDYHRQLTKRQHLTPVFFRTDEPVPGKVSEIQCPGSGWCVVEEIQTLYRNNPEVFGRSRHFPPSLAAEFSSTLRKHLKTEPVVHHLTDNASRPHGMRYFIQQTRRHGIRYFGYDRNIEPKHCNFVRSHDFITLPHHNFFAERMTACEAGELHFDLPPSVLFDGKIILAWPFWRKTREFYTDEFRTLFPFTDVISDDGFEVAPGEKMTLEAFAGLNRSKRNCFIKYAGSDIGINWGSKSVYLASHLSRPQIDSLAKRIQEDNRRGRLWIVQEALAHCEPVRFVCRNGDLAETDAHSKFSGFYGPDGLMSILVMQKSAPKVHGSGETVMSVVF